MNLKKYLQKHTTYIVNSSLGRFTYPLDMELDLVGLSYDNSLELQLSSGRVSSNGVYTKHFTQSVYGILFIHSVRFDIKESNSWVNNELSNLYKVKKLRVPNRERFIELESRDSSNLSPEYLLGLLMIPSVLELMFSSPMQSLNTPGEIVATIYDARGKERVYKLTDTSTMRSVYFELESCAPIKYLKQLGSIATNCTIEIEANGEIILDMSDIKRKESLLDYTDSIREKYFKLDHGGVK